MAKFTNVLTCSLQWKPLHFTNDKMKEVKEEEQKYLRSYCTCVYLPRADSAGVSWNQSFDLKDRPCVVISQQYRNSQDCNYALCYGIPIVTEAWLGLLSVKLNACWKKSPDWEDSFDVPSVDADGVRPTLEPHLKNRQSLSLWKADRSRQEMWSEWIVLELKKPKGVRWPEECAADVRPSWMLDTTRLWVLFWKRWTF